MFVERNSVHGFPQPPPICSIIEDATNAGVEGINIMILNKIIFSCHETHSFRSASPAHFPMFYFV
jgi:hypothetical protein